MMFAIYESQSWKRPAFLFLLNLNNCVFYRQKRIYLSNKIKKFDFDRVK